VSISDRWAWVLARLAASSLSDLMGGTITICVRIAELIRA
jgi:hypothetical protein